MDLRRRFGLRTPSASQPATPTSPAGIDDSSLLPGREPSSTQAARELELSQGPPQPHPDAGTTTAPNEGFDPLGPPQADQGITDSPRIPATGHTVLQAVAGAPATALLQTKPRGLGSPASKAGADSPGPPAYASGADPLEPDHPGLQLTTYDVLREVNQNDQDGAGAGALLQFQLGVFAQPIPGRYINPAAAGSSGPAPATEQYGLYVAPKPELTRHSLNKLQQRLHGAATGDANHSPRLTGMPVVHEHEPQDANGHPQPLGTGSAAPPGKWFDDDGELQVVPLPLKARKERPAKASLSPDGDSVLDTVVHRPSVQQGPAVTNKSYRLDVELSRLEFSSHPLMSREDQLSTKLLKAYRDFKKREAAGLAPYYAAKLAALEDALLASRESLFAEVEAGAPASQLETRTARTAKLEREVAEVRQIKEEEQVLLARMVKTMADLYQQLCQAHGPAAVPALQLVIEQAALSDDQVTIQAGRTRQQLDAMLLEAEADQIQGLPAAPALFPLPPAWSGLQYDLRRVETMCTAHMHARQHIQAELALLQGRVSYSPDDAEVTFFQKQLDELGPAPRRNPRSMEDIQALRVAAADAASREEVGVLRMPRLLVTLADNANSGEAVAPKPQRAMLGTRRYYTKLLVNGQMVGSSTASEMRNDFTVDLKDVFSVKLLKWPQSLQLQIFEKGTLRDDFLAEVYLGIPGTASSAPIDTVVKPYSWTSSLPYKQRQQSAEGGTPLFFYTEGTTFVRCGWVPEDTLLDLADASTGLTMQLSGNPLAEADSLRNDVELGRCLMPPIPHVAADRALQRAVALGKPTKEQLSKFLAGEVLDPNDPRNAPLLELLKVQQAQGILGLAGLFRLDPCADLALKIDRTHDKRTAFLRRRWKSGPYQLTGGQPSIHPAGARVMRIPAVLAPAEMAEAEPMLMQALSTFDGQGSDTNAAKDAEDKRRDRALYWTQGGMALAIEVREARIKEYAFRVRAATLGVVESTGRTATVKTHDVVREMQLPEFKLDLAAVQQLLAPRGKLQPRRRQQKFKQTGMPEKMELAVTLQRANYLPGRRSAPAATTRGGTSPNRRQRAAIERIREGSAGRSGVADPDDPDETVSRSTLETFAEVVFQGAAARTNSVQGPTPLWNEQVTLPFVPENGNNPDAVLQSLDYITVNVFDEVIAAPSEPSTSQRGQDGEGSRMDRIQYPERRRRFLGCVRIPISAIFQMGILEGTFKLDCPPVVLGYEDDVRSHAATVSVFAMLKPPSLPPNNLEELDTCCGEQEEIVRHAAKWKAAVSALQQCCKRPLQLFAVSTDGLTSLVCRYLAPSPLPPAVEQQINALREAGGGIIGAMALVARFVSLLPVLDSSTLQLHQDTWATTAEMMQMAGGGIHEHAHLLAGLFMELGVQAYVVVGTSTLGARSSYVLTDGEDYQPTAPTAASQSPPRTLLPEKMCIWNPLTGHATPLQDTACELLEVAMVYSSANVWANIQLVAQPYAMQWNLADPKAWRPLLGAGMLHREVASIQGPVPYGELEDRFYRELEARAEETVRDCVQSLKSAAVSQPSSKLCRKLRELLKEVPARLAEATRDSLVANRELAAQAAGYQTQEAAASALRARYRRLEELQKEHNQALDAEARGSIVAGHILALPFSDKYADSLREAIINTGIHRALASHSRFAMAAHVERTGVAFACCIWVYIVCTELAL